MKSFLSICLFVLFAIVLCSPAVNAQVRKERSVDGGILNGKAIKLPKPEYPQSAREAGAGGLVAVNVIVDEEGAVVFAEAELNDQHIRRAEDGTTMEPVLLDPALREAAENAARQARFSPSRITPLKVKGKIIYNFVAYKSDQPLRMGEVYGPFLNARATDLPAPAYPAAAKAVRVEGAVTVQVTIDEDGRVISASATSGHPLLRAAAETAARGATFLPTRLDNQPVKVTGVLTYNFVLPKKGDQ